VVSNPDWQDWLTRHGAVREAAGAPDGGAIESFGNPHAEYTWGQTESVLFDLSTHGRPPLAWLELTGNDRAKFLHNFCTQDVRALVPGCGGEAFVTTLQGKVLAHAHVWAGNESLALCVTADRVAPLLKHFDKYRITEDVEFVDRSAEFVTLLAAGPEAAERLTAAGLAASSLGEMNHCVVPGEGVRVARVGWLGQPGFLLAVPRARVVQWGDRLVAAGLHPAGHRAFEALRIEACFPWYGLDITDANLAQEVRRTKQAISFAKGCYLGQETVARIDALGHVNQQLCGIRFTAGPIPPAGTPVFAEGQADKPAGRITSATLSFTEDVPVGLAYLRRGHDRSGTRVWVNMEGGIVGGEVFWVDGE
jgi:tRNA-modifying protein YgfZ